MLTLPKPVSAQEVIDGAGGRIFRIFPQQQLHWPDTDPVVLWDNFDVDSSADFPEHLHRGFEIIMYMVVGGFSHKDATGLEKDIYEGEVLRFTTGKGATHSETPIGERAMGMQLWVNLPRKMKGIEPSAEMKGAENIPAETFDWGSIKRIAGDNGAIQINTPIDYRDFHFEKSGSYEYTIPEGWRAFGYLLDGSAEFGEIALKPKQIAIAETGTLTINATGDSRLFLVCAAKQNEQIRFYGPIVD